MDELIVSNQVQHKIKRGQFLLEKKDFLQEDKESRLVFLYGKEKNFLATAYLSEQHKGIGWVISREKIDINQAFFTRLFTLARKKRRSLFSSPLHNAYRLFHHEGDGFFGLTIDRYGEYAVFSWYNHFVYSLKDLICSAFRSVFPDIKGAYEKCRFQDRAYESAYLYGEKAPEVLFILENGVRYQVFLNQGLMTGIFLDQRLIRKQLLDGLALGCHVLNLFSYTAAFSVAAALGGALSTTSVDLANRSLALSSAHFSLNGIDQGAHHQVVMDAFDYMKYAQRKHLVFDLIILDPPSFARNKKRTFSVARDYHRLLAQSLPLLSKSGRLIVSTNAANVSKEQFKAQLEKGFSGTFHRYIAEYSLPEDFPYNKKNESSNYLKVFMIEVQK